MNFPTIITNDSVTVISNGKPYAFRKGDNQYANVIKAIKEEDWERVCEICDAPAAIKKQSNGKVIVKDGVVYHNGVPVHNVVVDRIVKFKEQGLPFQPLIRFLERLLKNPNPHSVQQLYKFLEHQNLPITENGTFLGYKYVKDDLSSVSVDERTNQHVHYALGKVTRMERSDVTNDPRVACGAGLHVGSLEYAKGWGGSRKIIVVEVDPADCVSVPDDCNFQKLRTCALKPVAIYKEALKKPLYKVNDKTHKVVLPKRDAKGHFIAKQGEFKAKEIKQGSLYRVVGVRRKVFRVIGTNQTVKHGTRFIVQHHENPAQVVPVWRLRRANKEEVARYLKH